MSGIKSDMKLNGKLTKYNSVEALKSETGPKDTDPLVVEERYRSLEKFINLLRKGTVENRAVSSKKVSK